MAECVTLARVIGRRIAHTIDIPVFYYGSASLNPQNEILANIGRGEFERMVHNSLLDKQLGQDVGPSRIHHSAGAVAIGVRDILIAFNINLRSRNIKIARQLAREIRERDGGLPGPM
jgi:glutamate formiminotransferase